jgi:hypothetical protein
MMAFAPVGSESLTGEAGIQITFVGSWVAEAPDGTKVSYEFTKEGAVIWRVEDEGFEQLAPDGLKGKYRVRVADPVWQIDITDFEHPEFKPFKFLGIIEILGEERFRMEGEPGRRPKSFGEGSLVFKLVEK